MLSLLLLGPQGPEGPEPGHYASGSPGARAPGSGRALCCVYAPSRCLCTYIGKFLWDPSVGSLSELPHCHHPAITAPPLDAPQSWTRTSAPIRGHALGEARLGAPPLFLSALCSWAPFPQGRGPLDCGPFQTGACGHPSLCPLSSPSPQWGWGWGWSSNTLLLAASAQSGPKSYD